MQRSSNPFRTINFASAIVFAFAMLSMFPSLSVVRGADWPMYRNDAGRSAATDQQLPDAMHLLWQRQYPQRVAAFGDEPRARLDEGYEPVISGKMIFVGSSADDSLIALASDSGAERWRFICEGPIRFAPVVSNGRVYVGSDDGYLYCLNSDDGKLIWKIRGGPGSRRVFGHDRLISAWPVTGGPVIADGVVYFACGFWPFNGIFVKAVDAGNGKEIWINDTAGDRGTTPFGYLAVVGDSLVLPCCGGEPARFDRATGKQLGYFPGGGYNEFDSDFASTGKFIFKGFYIVDTATGQAVKDRMAAEFRTRDHAPVMTPGMVYGINDGILKAYHLPFAGEGKKLSMPSAGRFWMVSHAPFQWSQDGTQLPLPADAKLPADWYAHQLHIKAGNRLYASGPDAVVAITDPGTDGSPRVTWVGQVDGQVTGMIAGDNKLLAMTRSGRIYCFGDVNIAAIPEVQKAAPATQPDRPEAFTGIKYASKEDDGFCVVLGISDGRMCEEIVRQSSMNVIAIDADESKIDALRRKWSSAGIYGNRIVALVDDPRSPRLPNYLARLVVSETGLPASANVADLTPVIFAMLHPFGATASLALSAADHESLVQTAAQLKLFGATIERKDSMTLLRRDGALAGTGDWTHEFCDAANSMTCNDTLRPPLGLTWFGGAIADRRNYVMGFHLPPPPQIVDGRIILQGLMRLTAFDVYTGRKIWQIPLPGFPEIADCRNGEMQLSAADDAWYAGELKRGPVLDKTQMCRFNGFNYVTLHDAIYLAAGPLIDKIAPTTGTLIAQWNLPAKALNEDAATLCWGNVRAEGDVLVATVFRTTDMQAAGLADKKDRRPMAFLLGLDRRSGDLLWTYKATSALSNQAICSGNGRVYGVDALTPDNNKAYLAAGRALPTEGPKIVALDIKSGKLIWTKPIDSQVSNLSYSVKQDILVAPSRVLVTWNKGGWLDQSKPSATDGAKHNKGADSVSGISRAYHGADGSVVWEDRDQSLFEPLIINGNTITTRMGLSYDLLTGKPATRVSLITGLSEEYRVGAGGCNHIIASLDLLCHRTAFFDLAGQDGDAALHGMRTGCTPSLVPANGMLSCLNFAAGYPSDPVGSAYGLAPQDDSVIFSQYTPEGTVDGSQIKRVGINFGAPGDNTAGETIWLGYPGGRNSPMTDRRLLVVTGADGKDAPAARRDKNDGIAYFDHHPSRITSAGDGAISWVAASGAIGIGKINVTLRPGDHTGAPAHYTVRLHFAEPENIQPGQRVFSISIQGKEVLKDLDLVKEAGGSNRAIIREFKGIEVSGALAIALTATPGSKPALLCGIEIISEEK